MAGYGAPFEVVLPQNGNALGHPVQIGDAIYIVGQDRGGLWRAETDGAPFEEILPQNGNALGHPVQIGDAIYSVSADNGGIWKFPSTLPARLDELQTSESLRRFVTDLPRSIQDDSVVQSSLQEFTRIEIARVGLVSVRSVTSERRDRFDHLPWAALSREDTVMSFDTFLRNCHTPAPENIEINQACLNSWTESNRINAQNWWQTLGAQVPPGILLLFLLGTLAALYRYNMRLAGFHHSRADILVLYSAGFVSERDMDALVKLAETLAADNVSFGKMQVGFGTGSIGIERSASKPD